MAASSRVLAIGLLAILAACAPTPTPAPIVAAPIPKAYSCTQQRQAQAEYDAQPVGSMLRTMVDDYGTERKALRGVLGVPVPAACPRS